MPTYTFENISKSIYFARRQTSTNPVGSITLYYNDTAKMLINLSLMVQQTNYCENNIQN